MPECRVCGNSYKAFISFGDMPIANGFLGPEYFADEYFFELAVGFCEKCGMVQLLEQPAPEKMFHENYAFFSSTSKRMAVHFEGFATTVMKNHCSSEDPFVVEIGSNDGIMLRHFSQAGIRHLGVEPSANVAAVARENGVNSISEFFNKALAENIIDDYGQADAVLAANVMCHIPDISSVADGVKRLLKPNGVMIFEDPYLGDIISKTSYDQIYDEHVFYFSATSIDWAFKQHGLELIDVAPQLTHGGSMRYSIAHQGAYPISDAAKSLIEHEEKSGLGRLETYNGFRKNVEKSRDELMILLERLKDEGKRVVGYAATSKSTTVTNYCGIKPDHIEFISDTTPIKQGKFSPGAHIPVKAYEEFKKNYPEYALLFAWNHSEEILANESDFMSDGGKWIVYVPEVFVQGSS